MTQGIKCEFQTREILVNSNTKTEHTDAFIIAWPKLEKQARRIFTYMVSSNREALMEELKRLNENALAEANNLLTKIAAPVEIPILAPRE